MKIAILADRLVMGGLETHILASINQLLKQGHQILLNTAYTNPDLLARIQTGNGQFEYKPWSDSARNDLAGFHPDIIHVHPFTAIFRGFEVARTLRLPLIITMHGLYDFGIDRSYLGDLVSDYAYAIIAVDPRVAGVLSSSTAHPEKVRIIYNGVDLTEFHPCPQKKIDPRLAGYINPDWKTLVVVSRLADGKERPVYQLLRCLPGISQCFNGLNVMVVGNGNWYDDLCQYASENVTTDDYLILHWAGEQSDVRPYLAAADLVLACDRAAIEGMACQRPVYGMNAQGFAGIIDSCNFQEIILYRRGYHELSDTELQLDLIQLLKDYQKREYYGVQGVEIVRQHFDILKVTAELEELYRSALMRRLEHG